MTAWRAELQQLTAAGIEPRYPWRGWLDGEPHHLVRGEDYHVATHRLQASAAAAARRRGVKLRSVATETGCTLVAVSAASTRVVQGTRGTHNPDGDGSTPSPATIAAAKGCRFKVVVDDKISQHMSGELCLDTGQPCALCGSSERHPIGGSPAADEVA